MTEPIATNLLPDFLPYYDRLLVRRLDEEVSSHYVLPDPAKQKSTWAEVVAVGPGQLLDSGSLSVMLSHVGDKVALGKYSGAEIKLDGREFVVLRESEVLGRVGGSDAGSGSSQKVAK